MSSRLRGWILVLFWALSLLVLAPPALFLFLFVRDPITIFLPARAACWIGHHIAGLQITVRGTAKMLKGHPCIYVANHHSWLDSTLMFLFLGGDLAFLAKKEMYRIPLFNPGLRWIGSAKIDRSNRERAIASIREAVERIREGRSFIVFPEGTRSRDGKLHPFKKGAFHLAIEAGVPVVPVTIDGSYDAMPPGIIQVNPGPVIFTIHDPIDTSGYSVDMVGDLAERAWRIVHSGFRNIQVAEGSSHLVENHRA